MQDAPSATLPNKGNVLLVDDEAAMGDYLVEGLNGAGFQTMSVRSGEQALAAIREREFDVTVTDLRMRGMDGLELCRRVHELSEALPVIVLTGFGDYAAAVAAIRAGAYDFLAKPVKLDVLALALARAVERRRLREQVRTLQQSLTSRGFGELVGTSAAMRKVYDLLTRVASTDASVLLTGESGTGKELVARALHAESARRGGPFVAINCAAVPESLLEGELFGYEKGAFTDAKASRVGLFVQAHGGTLFLDEVGELPLALQAKLLRALQERLVRPLGGTKEVGFDVRLITATNRDLETAVEEKRLREDFYFRINVVEVRLPPLRVRGNDVLALAAHFLKEVAARAQKAVVGITPEAAEKLLAYSWPGNVRELRNVIERAVALTAHDHVTVADLPDKIVEHRRQALMSDDAELITLEEMEKRYILQVLEAVGGSKSVAARTLGLDRSTLWRKLERFHVEEGKVPKP